MKKIFILLFVTFLTSSYIYSQNLSVPHYGIKLGVNCSNLNFHQYNESFLGSVEAIEGYSEPITKHNIGMKAGAFVDIRLTDKWYISPAISYSQFGSTTTLSRTFDVDTIRTYGEEKGVYKMDYITIDPNFEYRLTRRFSLHVGPSVAYLISNNVERIVTDDNVIRTDLAYNDEIDGVNNIDAGINFGTSLFLTDHLDVELNLYIGIIGIEKEGINNYLVTEYNKTTQSASFSIGYTF